jgi:YesN/AraC family two-component response regulator
MSVEQVAAAVGYSDPTALRRLIRKVNGTSPSRFRLASTVA